MVIRKSCQDAAARMWSSGRAARMWSSGSGYQDVTRMWSPQSGCQDLATRMGMGSPGRCQDLAARMWSTGSGCQDLASRMWSSGSGPGLPSWYSVKIVVRSDFSMCTLLSITGFSLFVFRNEITAVHSGFRIYIRFSITGTQYYDVTIYTCQNLYSVLHLWYSVMKLVHSDIRLVHSDLYSAFY